MTDWEQRARLLLGEFRRFLLGTPSQWASGLELVETVDKLLKEKNDE